MPHEFRMPDIGEGLTEAEILTWLVAEGDTVTIDQPVVEVETAKTTVEIPSPRTGTILRHMGRQGDTVNVGDVLFVIGEPDEAMAVDSGGAAQVPSHTESPASRGANRTTTHTTDASDPVKRSQAMPVVRKLARELGVDLTTLSGTGERGTITRGDVEAAAAGTPSKDERIEPIGSVRRAIAAHMTESWTTIPHVTVQAEVRAESLLAARTRHGDTPVPIEALVAFAVIPLLSTHPEFNAAFHRDGVAYRTAVDLGFAVDTPSGLKVVVIRAAHTMSISEVAGSLTRLARAAVDGTAAPDELRGQTFTISNIGALGGGHGTPIIPLGTSAILSIGRARPQPVVEDGQLAVGMVAPLDLSYDHRLIDGGLGQRFLSDLVDALEAP